ncbi:MAG TPA: non-canonical purine NTP pyrophosphatase, partial [Gemmatimonadetes bacterium]|nr:non-canonical purine NTP pyrophosphatase [Gemmatimonadota bacterium]
AKTFAELDVEQKNERSHRGKAFRALASILERMEF